MYYIIICKCIKLIVFVVFDMMLYYINRVFVRDDVNIYKVEYLLVIINYGWFLICLNNNFRFNIYNNLI